MPEEQDFHHTALSEGRAAIQQQNPSYTPTTIPPARIAENANLSDIFSFKFEANESLFLLSNTAANKQKAITAMYTKAEVKEKAIRLILDSGSAESIITYQLMQQLKKNVDRPAQTVIVTADGMKKTPKAPVFEFEEEKEKPVVEIFMALESTSNWAEETKQTYFATNSYSEEPETPGWNIPYSKPEPKK
ncbi:hypothetical protein G9A89_020154 [Geosiphon pyriformis]|nr:hypothetical protein G9A89_020154 [Geosiphon pyriformis]